MPECKIREASRGGATPGPGRVRVLFVISDLSGGGAERAVSTYLKHLDRSRFEPGLCVWRDEFTYAVPADVPVWVMGKYRFWQGPRTVLRMARLIRQWRPRIVFSHLPFVNFLVGLARRIAGHSGAWVACLHCSFQPGGRGWRRMLGKRLLNPTVMAGVSKGIAEAILRDEGLDPDKVVVLYNPIDFSRIDRSLDGRVVEDSPGPTIVTMGRLTESKDQATLLRAMAIVRKTHRVKLLILGQGPLQAQLEALVDALALREAVAFAGFVEDPFPRMAAADLFVLSSCREGLPMALMEAMACRVACISTRCPTGPEEIVEDGKTGVLVPVADPERLAGAIRRLLEDPRLRARIAEAGRASVRDRYNARNVTRALENLFHRLENRDAKT